MELRWTRSHDADFLQENTLVVGSVERKHAQKLALSMIERKRAKPAVPLGPPENHKHYQSDYFYA
jgi:hypothetical protein